MVHLVHAVGVLLAAKAGIRELRLIEPGVNQVQFGRPDNVKNAFAEPAFPDTDLGSDAALGHSLEKLQAPGASPGSVGFGCGFGGHLTTSSLCRHGKPRHPSGTAGLMEVRCPMTRGPPGFSSGNDPI
jgi:hypothetical protein